MDALWIGIAVAVAAAIATLLVNHYGLRLLDRRKPLHIHVETDPLLIWGDAPDWDPYACVVQKPPDQIGPPPSPRCRLWWAWAQEIGGVDAFDTVIQSCQAARSGVSDGAAHHQPRDVGHRHAACLADRQGQHRDRARLIQYDRGHTVRARLVQDSLERGLLVAHCPRAQHLAAAVQPGRVVLALADIQPDEHLHRCYRADASIPRSLGTTSRFPPRGSTRRRCRLRHSPPPGSAGDAGEGAQCRLRSVGGSSYTGYRRSASYGAPAAGSGRSERPPAKVRTKPPSHVREFCRPPRLSLRYALRQEAFSADNNTSSVQRTPCFVP